MEDKITKLEDVESAWPLAVIGASSALIAAVVIHFFDVIGIV